VQALCSGEGLRANDVFDLLDQLVAKSLVVAEVGSSEDDRYRLLETIRAYASERLEEAGEAATMQEAHALWYIELAEEAERELTGPEQERWFERLEKERANLRSALEWSLGHGRMEWALRLAGALVLFWRVRGHFGEGRRLLDAVASAANGHAAPLQAKVLWGAGFLALMAGDTVGAESAVKESLVRFRGLEDRAGSARALLILGNCRQQAGDPAALNLLEESARAAREAGDPWCLAHALGMAGLEHSSRGGELPVARQLFEECLHVAREAEDRQGLRLALLGLGSVALRQGDYPLAESLLKEAVTEARRLGEEYMEAAATACLGHLAIGTGDYDRARKLLEEVLRVVRELGSPAISLLMPLESLAWLTHAEGDRAGAERCYEETLALARAGAGSPLPSLLGLGDLALEVGDLGAARRHYEEALELSRASGDKRGRAQALAGLAQLAREDNGARIARELQAEALELQRQIGDAPAIAGSLEAMAGLVANGGHLEQAARLFGVAEKLRTTNHYARAPWESARYEVDLKLVEGGLSAKEFKAASARGMELSIEEAVADASKRRRRRMPPQAGWASLTETEQQVAALVAEGLSNAEIAGRLFISLGMVKKHVSNIFSKLGVTGRLGLAREFLGAEQSSENGS
ncbi:MAG: tetratricopeptide repeat protein, partial [Actinobacteria bacterium]|nr:tetratricopeptide repeat protein [Actinomycetota bacterium]